MYCDFLAEMPPHNLVRYFLLLYFLLCFSFCCSAFLGKSYTSVVVLLSNLSLSGEDNIHCYCIITCKKVVNYVETIFTVTVS